MREIKVTNKSASPQVVDSGTRLLFAAGETKVLSEGHFDRFSSLPYFNVERTFPESQPTLPEPVEDKEEVTTEPVVAEPEATPEVETTTEGGIAPVNQLSSEELFDICFKNDIISDNGGAWRSFNEVKAQGQDNFILEIESNEELRQQLIDELIKI